MNIPRFPLAHRANLNLNLSQILFPLKFIHILVCGITDNFYYYSSDFLTYSTDSTFLLPIYI